MTPAEDSSLVSVILPTCNVAPYIRATLRSALDQTHSNLEIIVADDGSSDATLAILKELASKDPRVRILEGEHTGHPGRVRNRALEQARGPYLAFLDADDLWTADKLADQIRRLENSRGADFCSTSARFIAPDEEVQSLEHSRPESEASPELRALPHGDAAAFENLLTRQRTIHTSSLMIRRSLFEATGPFSEEAGLQSGQDDDFILRAWRAGKPVTLREVYVLARRRPGSVSDRNSWENIFALIARADARERLPAGLRRRAWSAAWIVRGERSLRAADGPWRRAMFQAWRWDPFNPRRFPALLSTLLPRPWARRFYEAARRRGASFRD